MKSLDNHVDCAVEVGPDPVHLVDEADPGHGIFVGLPPNRLRLGLDARNSVKYNDASVQDSEASFHLGCEVHVAGCVNDIDQIVFPVSGGGGCRDGYAPLPLLVHPVHNRSAFVDLAHLVDAASEEEHPFGYGGLSCIYMSDEPDVPDHFQRWSGHGFGVASFYGLRLSHFFIFNLYQR